MGLVSGAVAVAVADAGLQPCQHCNGSHSLSPINNCSRLFATHNSLLFLLVMTVFSSPNLLSMRLPLSLLQFLSILSLFSPNPTSAKCTQYQKSSLLTLFSSVQYLSWTPNTDCCTWEGITCDGSTGHVIGLDLTNRSINGTINSTAFISLTSLRTLDLSFNLFNSSIPTSLGALSNLTHLNLSNSGFVGQVPVEISGMKRLVSLDLSTSIFDNYRSLLLPSPIFGYVVGNLSGLRELFLDEVGISSPVPESLFGLANLTSLHLSSCNLSGELPRKLFQLRNLESLDLSNNPLLTGTLPEFPLQNKLRILELSGTSVFGVLPNSFGNLKFLQRFQLQGCNFLGRIPSSLFSITQLVHLDISYNNFSGEIPSLENLTQLVYLDLSSNRLNGRIPSLGSLKNVVKIFLSSNNLSGPINLSFKKGLLNLTVLDLSRNSLEGKIPSILFTLPSLESLDLSHNQFDAQLDEFGDASWSLLSVDLSNNKLQGPIPRSIFELMGLQSLIFSSNNFNGKLDLAMLQSLKNLLVLDLSDNHLSINTSGVYTSFPPVYNMKLRSCNLTEFPDFLKDQLELVILDLSKNKISGEFRQTICNMNYLRFLDLSNNSMSGLIPECLGQMSNNLWVLNLGKNDFSGTLPRGFEDGCSLHSLNLNGNQLEGSIPRSFAKCEELNVINLGNNRMTDPFPSWLGSLQHLRVLILRSNKLYGQIGRPKDSYTFPQLQVIDLSSNDFTGNLSSEFFQSLKAMAVDEDKHHSKPYYRTFYSQRVPVTVKGLDMEYLKMLTTFITVDLSDNRFQGNIPQEIGNLKSLYSLNMSHNNFTGPIPSSFGNLLQLESLDLSMNQLSGAIPTELTALTFLQVVNLSQNHFTGSIPQAKQFLTFSNDSFQDNPGLCGPPLSRKCGPPSESKSVDSQDGKEFKWFYVWVGLGFGTGFWIVWGPLIFWTGGRRWYYQHVDKLLFVSKVWWDNFTMNCATTTR